MMKKHLARPRAALLIGAALLATPAFAQEAPTQTVTPPPIAVTPAQPQASTAAPRVEMAPSTPIVQPAPPPGPRPETVTEAAAPRAERAATRTTQTRQTTRQTTRAAAPVREAAPAPAAAAAPAAPIAQSPAPAAEAPAPAAAPATAPEAAAPPTADTTTTQTETNNGSGLAWPWLVGGLLLLVAGAAALLLMRRRREEDDVVEEQVYEEPVTLRPYQTPVAAAPAAAAPRPEPVVEPRREPELSPFMAATAAATAAPVAMPTAAEDDIAEAHVEAELAEPETEDLAGVTDAPAPVSNRPWLEFGLRPVRAGTSEEEALVDVELTVGNAGDVPARDVRISTFMLADADSSEMENLLTGREVDTAVPPVTIEPGDGTRVDAHLAVPKGEMGRVFNPVVVAEARYTLPDGREGRTSAMFKIGRPSPVSDGVGPIGATRPHMVDNVEAELLGTPEHA
jgi:hypothetical protein